MDRKLRMGMVGGGQEAWVGQFHRAAAMASKRAELVCGAFAATRQKSVESGEALGLAPKRVYGTYREMMRKEARLPADQRMDFVAITTPNNMHYPITMAAIDQGFHVICEAPMTTSMDEALNLRRKLEFMEKMFCLTHNYAGYPMVREARKWIDSGKLGPIRRVVVEFPQGWLATRQETSGQKQAGWRTDPKRSGMGGCIANLGSHCANLAEFVTGLEISEVSADLHTFIAGRQLDDDGSVLLRFNNGARGVIWASQVAAGEGNGLAIRVYGEKGGLTWCHETAETLTISRLGKRPKVLHAEPPKEKAPAAEAIWMPKTAGKGYVRSLATIYDSFYDALEQRLDGKQNIEATYPGIEEGIRVMSFVDATVRNSKSAEKWQELLFEVDYSDFG